MDADDRAFREAGDALLPFRARVCALTCLAANGAFAAVDHLALAPEPALFRTWVRIGFTPLYLLLMILASHRWGRRRPRAVVIALAVVLAAELSLVGIQLPSAESVGFFPGMLFFAAFLPLPLIETGMVVALFVVAFAAAHLGLGVTPPGLVIKHAGNLTAAAGVAIVAAYLAERLRRSEFDASRRLAEAHRRLEEVVERERSFNALLKNAEEARRLSAAMMGAEDAERRRLARDLHDTTGQTLIAALLHLDLALRAQPSLASIATAREHVDQALEGIRALARDLHPPTLAQFGLAETLRALATSMSGPQTTIEAEISAAAPSQLPAAVALGCFRIAQAALANALQHGHARRVLMRLGFEHEALRLEIEDDGAGFSPDDVRHGVGLISMRERASSLGGTLAIESATAGGTRVRVVIPLAASGAGASRAVSSKA